MDGVDLNDEKPPLHVFSDMEVMQDTGRHVPNLFNTLFINPTSDAFLTLPTSC